MTNIPHGDFPIKYKEFKHQVEERIDKLERDGVGIAGIAVHPKTARTLIMLVYENEITIKPTITYEVFGLRLFPTTSIREEDYYFLVN